MIYLTRQALASGIPGPPALMLLAGFVCGCGLGLAHFASLARNVHLLVEGRALGAILMQIARLIFLGAALFALALWGALPLLGAATGLLTGRHLVLKRMAPPT